MTQFITKPVSVVTFIAIIAFFIASSSCKKDDECILPAISYITDYHTGERVDGIARSSAYVIHGRNFTGVAYLNINGLIIDDWALTDTNINFNTPSDISTRDSTKSLDDEIILRKQCGQAIKKVDILPPAPLITRISNEYAIAGDEITITGRYFIDMRRYAFSPDNIDGEVSTFVDSICTLEIPVGVESSHDLVLITSEGDSSSNATGVRYRDSEGLVCNFDDINNYASTDGQITSNGTGIAKANGNVFVASASNIAAGTSNVSTMHLPLRFDIDFDYDGARPAYLMALEFEMFSTSDWQNGYYTFEVGYKNESDEIEFAYTYNFNPANDEDYADTHVGNWLTFSLPFSRFQLKSSSGIYAQSFGQLRVVNYIDCRFTTGSAVSQLSIAMDNFRISEISGY